MSRKFEEEQTKHNTFLEVLQLNVLWILYCLPIVTIGVSTAAVYYVANKMVKKEQYEIRSDFKKAFHDDLKDGIKLWIGYVVIGCILGYSAYQYFYVIPSTFILKKILVVIGLVLYSFSLLYIFPVIARYSSTISHSIWNSILVPFRFPVYTIGMVLVVVVFVAGAIYCPYLIILEVFPLAGVVFYFFSKLFQLIYQNLEELTVREKELRERLMAEIEAEEKKREEEKCLEEQLAKENEMKEQLLHSDANQNGIDSSESSLKKGVNNNKKNEESSGYTLDPSRIGKDMFVKNKNRVPEKKTAKTSTKVSFVDHTKETGNKKNTASNSNKSNHLDR